MTRPRSSRSRAERRSVGKRTCRVRKRDFGSWGDGSWLDWCGCWAVEEREVIREVAKARGDGRVDVMI